MCRNHESRGTARSPLSALPTLKFKLNSPRIKHDLVRLLDFLIDHGPEALSPFPNPECGTPKPYPQKLALFKNKAVGSWKARRLELHGTLQCNLYDGSTHPSHVVLLHHGHIIMRYRTAFSEKSSSVRQPACNLRSCVSHGLWNWLLNVEHRVATLKRDRCYKSAALASQLLENHLQGHVCIRFI